MSDLSQPKVPFKPHEDFVGLDCVEQGMAGNVVNVMAVVTDIGTPTSTRGTDYLQTIRLRDLVADREVTARIFRRNTADFPAFTGSGTKPIIAFYGMKVSKLGENYILLSSFQYQYGMVTFSDTGNDRDNRLTKGPTAKPGRVTGSMLEKMRELYNWWTNKSEIAPEQPSEPIQKSGRRDTLIEDLELDSNPKRSRYYNIIGEVVRVYHHPERDDRATVFITDYTKNPKLYSYTYNEDDGSDTIWPGPMGCRTLQITLWDLNAVHALDVRVGECIYLCNVATKMNPNGLLEGALHGDRQYPEKRHIWTTLDSTDPKILALEERRAAYSRDYEKNKSEFITSTPKAQKDKSETKPNNQLQESGQAQKRKGSTKVNDADYNSDTDSEAEENSPTKKRAKLDKNPDIRAENPTHPETSIAKIVRPLKNGELFRNVIYRMCGRVLDYQPDNLEDFAVRVEPGEVERDPDSEVEDEYHSGNEKWAWRFQLLIQGVDGTTIPVIVSGKEGEYLLKSQACDLRSDEHALENLREQLTKLWGNLEDFKIWKTQKALEIPQKNLAERAKNFADPTVADQKLVETTNPPANNARGDKKKRRRGRAKKNKKANDNAVSENQQENDDEDEDEEVRLSNRLFDANIFEYGVGEGDACQRMWKLAKTVIH